MMQLIGHRGASAYAPENTIAAFEKARELGCNFIEFDYVCNSRLTIQLGNIFRLHSDPLYPDFSLGICKVK